MISGYVGVCFPDKKCVLTIYKILKKRTNRTKNSQGKKSCTLEKTTAETK
jgi:hypothetical protein